MGELPIDRRLFPQQSLSQSLSSLESTSRGSASLWCFVYVSLSATQRRLLTDSRRVMPKVQSRHHCSDPTQAPISLQFRVSRRIQTTASTAIDLIRCGEGTVRRTPLSE